MAPPLHLLGPPEIQFPPDAGKPHTTSGDPFMDLLTSNFNAQLPLMGLTENRSPTFLSTGNPCLDFFFHIVPDTPPETLSQRLESAWKHDPLTALKLICQLRGVRGTGKSDKESFYTAALWLHQNHPKTLACNIRVFSEFGYLKDLPEILFRLLEGLDVRRIDKEERIKKGKRRWRKRSSKKHKQERDESLLRPREERVSVEMEKIKREKEEARDLRKKRTVEMARKAVERYGRDPDYRFLHDRISDLFADLLISDLNFLISDDLKSISLASKWCPSLDSSYDRSTLLCESIATRVFPRDFDPEYEKIEDRHYVYRARERLRKQVLVLLRKTLELPEIYISSNRWNSLPYNRVASVAMKTYKKLFKKHDGERFFEFLENVRQGKAKIAAGALLPHDIIASASSDDGDVAELQWRRMVDDLSKKGKLRNCIAVCDVSGSMTGTPMEVCVALGLLISDLSEEPWKGNVITFSENPQLHKIVGETIREKSKFVREMEWGMNTDFQRVFDQILRVAIGGKLKEDQMIKRVFVFSDMEFDQASSNDWETDYMAIQRKFREKGYVTVPEIVFWNLRDSRATPAPSGEKGVALVSGFSKNLLTLFLEGGGVLKPEEVMEKAISGEEYEKLVVFD